jgi:hypothetical protein
MNALKTTLLVALVGASSLAFADAPVTDTTRDQRMDQALQDYRNHPASTGTSRSSRADRNTSGEGPAARAEDKIKNGAERTGHAIGNGARATGHAIGNAGRATGHAIHRGADKVTGKTPAP